LNAKNSHQMTLTEEPSADALKETLRDALKEILTEVLTTTSMRPAVIESDSGVSSVTRETLANGSTKITTKIYHEDPEMADILCARIFERATAYAHNHAPGAPYPPKE
jgi:hypothetical protein